MMKRITLLILLLVLSGVWLLARSVNAYQGGFIIERADAVRTAETTGSAGLSDRLDDVLARFVLQFANQIRQQNITPAPAQLANELSQALPRYVIQFANANRFVRVTNTPAAFDTLLQNTTPRFIVQFANSLRAEPLLFPVELVDDNTPPTISQPDTTQPTGNSVRISWTTNEFATSEIRYGTSPGSYPWTVSDPLYVKEHVIVIPDLSEGDYYYRIFNTDLSGNVRQSAQHTFTVVEQSFLYLPFLKR